MTTVTTAMLHQDSRAGEWLISHRGDQHRNTQLRLLQYIRLDYTSIGLILNSIEIAEERPNTQIMPKWSFYAKVSR